MNRPIVGSYSRWQRAIPPAEADQSRIGICQSAGKADGQVEGREAVVIGDAEAVAFDFLGDLTGGGSTSNISFILDFSVSPAYPADSGRIHRMDMKTLIFFLPLPIAVAVAWHCRRRGIRFSRWLVYVLPFLLPVVFCIINIKMDSNLLSPLLGKELALTFIVPYWWSVLTSGALILLKSISAFVRAGIGALSFPELFCLHAGAFVLGSVFSIFLMIGASPDVGMF